MGGSWINVGPRTRVVQTGCYLVPPKFQYYPDFHKIRADCPRDSAVRVNSRTAKACRVHPAWASAIGREHSHFAPPPTGLGRSPTQQPTVFTGHAFWKQPQVALLHNMDYSSALSLGGPPRDSADRASRCSRVCTPSRLLQMLEKYPVPISRMH